MIPPKNERQREMSRLIGRLAGTTRYKRAKSCQFCTDTADSFNRYEGTYCHVKHKTIADLGVDELEKCFECPEYQKRRGKK